MSWPEPQGPHTTFTVLHYVAKQCHSLTQGAESRPTSRVQKEKQPFFPVQALTFNQTQIPLCLLTYQADTGCGALP